MPTPDTLSVNPLPTKAPTTTISSPKEGEGSTAYSHAPPKTGAKLPVPTGDKTSEVKAEPFTLGEGLPVLPPKVVAKILLGDYVEMAELLQDNKLTTVNSRQ